MTINTGIHGQNNMKSNNDTVVLYVDIYIYIYMDIPGTQFNRSLLNGAFDP